jgi:two-component system cell cycle sensor histidine kinase/response regulator CckA
VKAAVFMGRPGGARSFVLALLSTAAALAVTRLTWPFFTPTPFAPLFAAVAITTHWGSAPAGVAVIVLGTLGAAATFPTAGSHPWNPLTLPAFVLVALIGNFLIAARNRATAALRESEAQLRATLEHLRESEESLRRAQKVEAIGQLAAGVAHNFNNLLTITMGYADILEEDGADAAQRRTAIQEIRTATTRGATLARQMLTFGRRHDPKMARVALDSTIAKISDMLTRVLREDIRLTITAGSGGLVLIDPHDLEQVILNLVFNARDALPDGGEIEVTSFVATVAADDSRRVAPAEPGDYVCVRVRDNGVGMSADAQAHLFEPFFTTKEVGEGTGLGLAFVHGVAQHAGGFVTVQTAAGSGTTVSVYLPPAPVASGGSAGGGPAAAPVAPSTATILLVEDEEGVRRMTDQMLTRAGFRVLAAASPAEARVLFERHADEITLLVTDVIMPGMHGPALADLLLIRRPDLPVLFVSGYSDVMPESSTRPGHSAFLAKPFSFAVLTTAVDRLLERATPARR